MMTGYDVSLRGAPRGFTACQCGLWMLLAREPLLPDALTVAEYDAMPVQARDVLYNWLARRLRGIRLPLPRILHETLPERYVLRLQIEVA